MKPLADDFTVVYRAEDPSRDFLYTPSILVRESGRYIMSLDIRDVAGKMLISDDKGEHWTLKGEASFFHASLFADGGRIYLLGCSTREAGRSAKRDLVIFYSDDEGESWSEGSFLTDGETWNHCATDVWYKDGYVYIPMDCKFEKEGETIRSGWKPNIIAPVLLRGKLGMDLTKRENWLFSERVRFRDVVKEEELDFFGVPFFKSIEELGDDDVHGETFWGNPKMYRDAYNFAEDKPSLPFYFHATGWLEANVVQITNPKHYWYDPTGKTLHLFMRANTHGSGYCCMMKAVEKVVDGKEIISIECERNPSGRCVVFLPMPGGQNKFFVKYDPVTSLYWLVSVQARDSMTRMEYLSDDRYNVPSDERDRLALHFSTNMVDWCFAGLVDQSGFDKQSRHYASMDIDGEDLLILSRSGDQDAYSAHDGNIITLHRVKTFRDLVY